MPFFLPASLKPVCFTAAGIVAGVADISAATITNWTLTLSVTEFTALSGVPAARIAYQQWQAGLRPTLQDLKPLYLRPPAVDEKTP